MAGHRRQTIRFLRHRADALFGIPAPLVMGASFVVFGFIS